MSGIKAIETRYKGYRFRSRLEARWAVFFDALNVSWEYESEGYTLETDWFNNGPDELQNKETILYLPDFYFPQISAYAEIKPEFSRREVAVCSVLASQSKKAVWLLEGTPTDWTYWATIGLEFEHGGWSMVLRCLDIGAAFHLLEIEGHFHYGDTEWWDFYGPILPLQGKTYKSLSEHAIKAARSARFEHGESPVFTKGN